MKTTKTDSPIRRVTEQIRDAALQLPDGQMLGSEDELVARFNVSRPTLRLAAAIVSQEHLLTIKRGARGGYFARRPDSRAVAHLAAVYLRSRHAQVSEIVPAMAPLREELSRLACHHQGEDTERLKAFVEQEREVGEADVALRDFLRTEREFGKLLAEVSGNRVIALFYETLLDLAALIPPEDDLFLKKPDRVREHRRQRNRLAEAVLGGDEDFALVEARRLSALSRRWLAETSPATSSIGARRKS